jgi:hypothetical protein
MKGDFYMKTMRKILALILAVMSALAITAPALAASGVVDSSHGSTPYGTVSYYSGYNSTVSTSGLTNKGTKSHGTNLTVTSVNDHWYRFTQNGSYRYILRQFVRVSGLEWEIRYGTMELNLGCSWTRYVKQMQIDLTALDYDTNGTDGAFGSDTRDALIDFQTANGLTADGRCGPASKAALYVAIN